MASFALGGFQYRISISIRSIDAVITTMEIITSRYAACVSMAVDAVAYFICWRVSFGQLSNHRRNKVMLSPLRNAISVAILPKRVDAFRAASRAWPLLGVDFRRWPCHLITSS